MHVLDFSKYEMLYNHGLGFRDNGNLILTDFELFYAFENGIIKEKILEKETLKAKDIVEKNRNAYLVFKMLRNNEYIARETYEVETSSIYLLVGKKGFRQEKDRTAYIIKVFNDNEEIRMEKFERDVRNALDMKKSLVYAIVHEEKIDFYGIINMKFD